MSEMIEISFKYSESEYVLAMREYYANAMRLRTDIFAGGPPWSPATSWMIRSKRH